MELSCEYRMVAQIQARFKNGVFWVPVGEPVPTGKRQLNRLEPTLRQLRRGYRHHNGTRYATYGYDPQGRAISTEHAGGAERHTLAYASTTTGNSTTTVTDPLGTARTYRFQTLQGVAHLVKALGIGGGL